MRFPHFLFDFSLISAWWVLLCSLSLFPFRPPSSFPVVNLHYHIPPLFARPARSLLYHTPSVPETMIGGPVFPSGTTALTFSYPSVNSLNYLVSTRPLGPPLLFVETAVFPPRLRNKHIFWLTLRSFSVFPPALHFIPWLTFLSASSDSS